MADKKVRVGIVGYGKVGAGGHRHWVNASARAVLVSICDTTPARRDAARTDNPEARIYDDYEAFLADGELDLVVVTTPPSSHCELSVAASKAGKNVFVDKPFAMNRREAEAMIDAAKKARKVIHCHQSRRYDGEYRRIRDLVRAGKIGEVRHIRRVWSQYGMGWATWGIEGFNPTWRIQSAFGGGMVYDYAPHCGDQILHLVGSPLKQVFADVRSLKFSDEVDDHFSAMLRFANGTTAYLEASNLSMLPAPHWYITGSKGCITAETVGGKVSLKTEASDEVTVYDPLEERHTLYENLIASCLGEAQPNVTAPELLNSSSLIDALFRSSSSRSVVAVE